MGQIKAKCNEERASNKQSDGKAYFEFKLHFYQVLLSKDERNTLKQLIKL